MWLIAGRRTQTGQTRQTPFKMASLAASTSVFAGRAVAARAVTRAAAVSTTTKAVLWGSMGTTW